jgi:Domain of unknown function (DUF4126)
VRVEREQGRKARPDDANAPALPAWFAADWFVTCRAPLFAPSCFTVALNIGVDSTSWPHTDVVELLTGLGLATAAGLNAYIPLLALGLLSRFTGLVDLPHGYAWLENGWVLTIVAVLLAVEIVADKIPALDSVNDAIQTFVRPTAGGIVFGSGTAAQTPAVTDPGAFAQSGQWVPIVVGVVVALVVSLTKSAVRPAANVATAGVAAPVLSSVEDGISISLVFIAILIPVLVLVVLVLLVWAVVKLLRRRRRQKAAASETPGL